MRVERFESAVAFRDVVFPFLLQEEALHCVGLGVVGTLVERPLSGACFLAAVRDGNRTVGAAWLTPPYPLGISRLPETAVPVLVEWAASLPVPLRGVVGPSAGVDEFHRLWSALLLSRDRRRESHLQRDL